MTSTDMSLVRSAANYSQVCDSSSRGCLKGNLQQNPMICLKEETFTVRETFGPFVFDQ